MSAPKLTPFTSVLIANRGEIACRLIRTAKRMGYTTVAVYSDADCGAPHVKMADQAVHIGGAPVGESYLVGEKIIAAAKSSGAEAIHPGYGFLSENAAFAAACEEAGFVFVGPSPNAIELMGDKAKSKRRMMKAGVPCVPGYQGERQDDATLIKEAELIGCPIMVKAAAGGGGRGMRLVNAFADLPNAIKDARSEALNAFGSDVLILERAVQRPRHVEIQVFADKYGQTIHLAERDCSVQRRHQKVLEEAPCPVMTPELREAMGAAAVTAAMDIGYVGAGTVEFLLSETGEFFFLEMNTRLQVEHPVTECITGLDLAELQFRVASGESLGLTQDDVHLSGHAIEARLYAEDPTADFLPATGPIHYWNPACGEGIRIDSGVASGGEVSPFYDPMIAKIIAYGDNREDARRKLIRAIEETSIVGVSTNRSFLLNALEKKAFIEGIATTAFISENFKKDDLARAPLSATEVAIGAVLQYELARQAALGKSLEVDCAILNWSSATPITTPYEYGEDDAAIRAAITPISTTLYSVDLLGKTLQVSVLSRGADTALIDVDGCRHAVSFHAKDSAHIDISLERNNFSLQNRFGIFANVGGERGGGAVVAPMHGALIELFVTEGDLVKKGQRLAILEAMKMQHEILAQVDGRVTDIHVEAGVQVAADTLMIEIKEEETPQ